MFGLVVALNFGCVVLVGIALATRSVAVKRRFFLFFRDHCWGGCDRLGAEFLMIKLLNCVRFFQWKRNLSDIAKQLSHYQCSAQRNIVCLNRILTSDLLTLIFMSQIK